LNGREQLISDLKQPSVIKTGAVFYLLHSFTLIRKKSNKKQKESNKKRKEANKKRKGANKKRKEAKKKRKDELNERKFSLY